MFIFRSEYMFNIQTEIGVCPKFFLKSSILIIPVSMLEPLSLWKFYLLLRSVRKHKCIANTFGSFRFMNKLKISLSKFLLGSSSSSSSLKT